MRLLFWAGAIAGAVVVLALLALFFASVARAQAQHDHKWYPRTCCTPGDDCRVMALNEVRVTQLGYYLPDLDRTVLFDAANSSPDGNYHICIDDWNNSLRKNRNADPMMNRSPLCFWAPEGSS